MRGTILVTFSSFKSKGILTEHVRKLQQQSAPSVPPVLNYKKLIAFSLHLPYKPYKRVFIRLHQYTHKVITEDPR